MGGDSQGAMRGSGECSPRQPTLAWPVAECQASQQAHPLALVGVCRVRPLKWAPVARGRLLLRSWPAETSCPQRTHGFMIPRYWHWRHACSDPCIMPTHEHSPHRMPQFTLEVQFSFPEHLVFQADQNKKYFEGFKHKNSLPLVLLPFLLTSRAVDNT